MSLRRKGMSAFLVTHSIVWGCDTSGHEETIQLGFTGFFKQEVPRGEQVVRWRAELPCLEIACNVQQKRFKPETGTVALSKLINATWD